MTDATSAPRSPRVKKTEEPEVVEAEVVDGEVVEAEVVEETARPSETEPVVATVEPDSVQTEQAPPASETGSAERIVYVTAPAAPRKLGNRGIGALLAVVSAVVYLVLLALVFAVVGRAYDFAFLAQSTFYVPALFYVIGAVLLVLILNRAGWAAHVLGSLLVGLVVYFGTVGLLLLGQGVVLMSPAEASALFLDGLRNPFVIAAALLAREVSLWTGAIVARRGRSLKARNAEAHAAWEREVAEKRAEAEARR